MNQSKSVQSLQRFLSFTDHVSIASDENRKHGARKQILKFYAVSVKKKVKYYEIKKFKAIQLKTKMGRMFSKVTPFSCIMPSKVIC